MCIAISECIKENTGLSLFKHFIPEETFCDTHYGYGGTCDLHTNRMEYAWVIDYKSKDEVTAKTKGYDSHADQLAAYANGFGMRHAKQANLFISRTPPPEGEPWAVKFYEHKNTEIAWARFKHTLMTWQIIKKYGPYYSRYIENLIPPELQHRSNT